MQGGKWEPWNPIPTWFKSWFGYFLLDKSPDFSEYLLLMLKIQKNSKTYSQCVSFFIVIKYILLLFSCSIVSDSLTPYGLQRTRLPFLSFTIFWS